MTARAQWHRLEGEGLIRVAVTQAKLEYLFRQELIQAAAGVTLVVDDWRALTGTG